MKKTFEISETFPVKPQVIFDAWLDSLIHTKMTGGNEVCSNKINGEFSAWDGYISGVNLALHAPNEMIQQWRTTEFMEQDEDSLVRIKLVETTDGCELILQHSNIPEGEADYEKGWVDFYFTPMKAYFSK